MTTERWCKKCNKMCHCLNTEDECTNCECNGRAEDKSFENEGGLVIDDTGECDSCQYYGGLLWTTDLQQF